MKANALAVSGMLKYEFNREPVMDYDAKIYIAGHQGLVGSALVRALKAQGFHHLLLRSRAQLDLTCQAAVEEFFLTERPDYVFLAAAKVGGIDANNRYRAEFIYENLMIEANVIHSAYQAEVQKLLFLGSSCIYPKFAPQPIQEEHLLTGTLEPTNEPYAIAKIAGIKLCESYCRQYGVNFISAMPTNLYGRGDNFNLQTSHVLPALLRKFHEAKLADAPTVSVWGTGKALREFLYVDDLADGLIFLMQQYHQPELINVGSGEEVSICELAELIQDVVGYEGAIAFDPSKPDGTPRKLMDSQRIHQLGWRAQTSLKEGVAQTYNWFLQGYDSPLPQALVSSAVSHWSK